MSGEPDGISKYFSDFPVNRMACQPVFRVFRRTGRHAGAFFELSGAPETMPAHFSSCPVYRMA
jgi:hypothetical protein